MKKYNALLLEDDKNLGFILSEQLESNGFTVKLCTNGIDGSEEYKKNKFDICLVDIMMPKKDGFTFVKELRSVDEKIPVIFLTAKSLREDKIEGFKLGCDDYITKPFSIEELLLRIKAVMRRINPGQTEQTVFCIGKYKFDSIKQVLLFRNKQQPLTSKESELLLMLCRNLNKILERDYALITIWGDNSYFNTRSMDVYISKLRKYFKDDAAIKIQNLHGKGYKMIVDDKNNN